MKFITVDYDQLISEERWDIDYHLPAIEITKFDERLITTIDTCADIIRDTRNPTLEPEEGFLYIDISCVDIVTGMITSPQELTGEEAPSRARKVVRAGDIIISTCRPTRRAIAIVPEELDNQICSTGFSVIRAKEGVNPEYLHFILRSDSTKEQFRKFSTGSSYPAILDDDVMKTRIPLPGKPMQDIIAQAVSVSTAERNARIATINKEWEAKLGLVINDLKSKR